MADMFQLLPEIQGDELIYIQALLRDTDDDTAQRFAMVYRMRRREPVTILLLTIIGFLGIAGIQRFYVEQIGLGLIYLLTAGICGIGTIIDLITFRRIAFEYNQKQAYEVITLLKK
ncbi:MAG: TM2 domain-containing protein [Candidatus Zixiibacteriota bacterium]